MIFAKENTTPLADAYWQALEDIPTAPLMVAMKKATTSMKFFPKPVELRQMAGELSPEDRAARAFEFVQGAIRHINVYNSPDFDDPLINATIATLGGWIRLCDLVGEERENWYRQRFIATYQSKMRTGIGPTEGGPLFGLCKAHNTRAGYDVGSNEMIGGPRLVTTDLPQLPHIRKPDAERIETGVRKPLLELKKP